MKRLLALLWIMSSPCWVQAQVRVTPESGLLNAIEHAKAGDTLWVMPGVYRQDLIVVDKALTLLGKEGAILEPAGEHSILKITADGCHVEGFLFRNAPINYTRDFAALEVFEAKQAKVLNNRFENNFFGIYLAESEQVLVQGNQLRAYNTKEASSGNGIHIWNSKELTVQHNRIEGHRDGIYLEFADAVQIRHNESIANNRYGLHYMFSKNSYYEHNQFTQNGAGVAVMYSRDVHMNYNVFNDNWGPASYGLLLKDMAQSEVIGNRFLNNSSGLYAEGCTDIQVTRNHFFGNGWAVKLMANCEKMRFTENNFVGNAFDVATNSRRNVNEFNRNFWSQYNGYDLTGNGVGDVPYRPVRLFSLVIEKNPTALVLSRSLFVEMLDLAERIIPTLTPEALTDPNPLMKEIAL